MTYSPYSASVKEVSALHPTMPSLTLRHGGVGLSTGSLCHHQHDVRACRPQVQAYCITGGGCVLPAVLPQTENIRIAYIDEIPPGNSNVSFRLNVVSVCKQGSTAPSKHRWFKQKLWHTKSVFLPVLA